ncbi:MAG: MupG family TIM beta-alpha barrel fold protein [Bifidobacteriaceae bacterium]|nr:MupG family TIM beta-alpha barrel fold protein [Bifidobacteriaceae bacterium]
MQNKNPNNLKNKNQKPQIGISVYFKDFDKTYVEKILRTGITDVFTSLHIPEEDFSQLLERFKILSELCFKYKVNLIPDISPIGFKKLKITKTTAFDFFKEHKVNNLRLDFGFDDIRYVKELYNNFSLILNASTLTEKLYKDYIDAGIDIKKVRFLHNFYPKINSGLSKNDLIKKNKFLKEKNIENLAFVAGDLLKRFPYYDGLPTLEKHRGMHPFPAAVELLEDCQVNGILSGDSKISCESIKYIADFMQNKIINLPCVLYKEYAKYYDKELGLRVDNGEKVLRILSTRIPDIEPSKTADRQAGTITIDNKLACRYSGEIEITKNNLPFSNSANLMGYISPQFLPLLQYANSQYKIRFINTL